MITRIKHFKNKINETLINQSNYGFYIVDVDIMKIVEGFEFRQDALDRIKEMDLTNKNLKVYSYTFLMNKKIYPKFNPNWVGNEYFDNINEDFDYRNNMMNFNLLKNMDFEDLMDTLVQKCRMLKVRNSEQMNNDFLNSIQGINHSNYREHIEYYKAAKAGLIPKEYVNVVKFLLK